MPSKRDINLVGFGSLPMSKRKAIMKDGVRRINGRQVDLVMRLATENQWKGERLLQLIRECCPGVTVDGVEDIVDGPPMQEVVSRIKGKNLL